MTVTIAEFLQRELPPLMTRCYIEQTAQTQGWEDAWFAVRRRALLDLLWACIPFPEANAIYNEANKAAVAAFEVAWAEIERNRAESDRLHALKTFEFRLDPWNEETGTWLISPDNPREYYGDHREWAIAKAKDAFRFLDIGEWEHTPKISVTAIGKDWERTVAIVHRDGTVEEWEF